MMDINTLYQEPSSRLQLADKLSHMISYSDFLILLLGESGSGKTRLLNQLEKLQEPRTQRVYKLELESQHDVTQLLIKLVELMELDAELLQDNRKRLAAVIAHLKSLQDVDIVVMIYVDDADCLSDNALELLLSLLKMKPVAPHLLFASMPEFLERFEQLGWVEKFSKQLHVQRLLPFSDKEAVEFLEVCVDGNHSVSARQLSKLVKMSDNLPGGLLNVLTMYITPSTLHSSRIKAFPFPPLHLAGIIIALLVILGLSVWHYLPDPAGAEQNPAAIQIQDTLAQNPETVQDKDPSADDSVSEAKSAANNEEEYIERVREEQRQRLQQAEEALNTTNANSSDVIEEASAVNTPEPLVVETPAISERAAEPEITQAPEVAPEPEIAQAPEVAPEPAVAPEPTVVSVPEVVSVPQVEAEASTSAVTSIASPEVSETIQTSETAQVVEETVTEETVTEETVTEEAVAETVPEAPISPTAEQSPNAGYAMQGDEILTWPENAFTLQVLGARSEASVQRFINAQANPQQFYAFATELTGRPWFVVIYGQYASRSAATNAVSSLPQPLQAQSPWPRSLASVQNDIRVLSN